MSKEGRMRTRNSRQKRKLFSLEDHGSESVGPKCVRVSDAGEKKTPLSACKDNKSSVKVQKFYDVNEVIEQTGATHKYVINKDGERFLSLADATDLESESDDLWSDSEDDYESEWYGLKTRQHRDLAGSLRSWIKRCKVHPVYVDSLLKILRPHHPNLPRTGKALFKKKMPQAKYAVVEFLDTEVQLQGQLAVVPTHFVKCDNKKAFYTQYLNPPYDKESLDLLENIVRSHTTAPSHWKLYKSKILKFNLIFEDAELSFCELAKNKNLLTPKKTDIHPSSSNIASFVNENAEITDELFSVPDLSEVVMEVSSVNNNGQAHSGMTSRTIQIIGGSTNSIGTNMSQNTSCPNLKNADSTASATKADLNEMQQNISNQINKLLVGINVSMNNVNGQMTSLDQKIINLQKDVWELKNFTMGQPGQPIENLNIVTLRELSEISGFTFPFAEKDDFALFDNALKEEDLFNKVRSHFIATIDNRQALNKIVTVSLQKFFRGDVLRRYTATKKIKDKDVFKVTNFYMCLKEALMYACPAQKVDDHILTNLIGTVINNCVDWHGNRLKRQRFSVKRSQDNDNSEDWHEGLLNKSQKSSEENAENAENMENMESMETIENIENIESVDNTENENSKDFKESS